MLQHPLGCAKHQFAQEGITITSHLPSALRWRTHARVRTHPPAPNRNEVLQNLTGDDNTDQVG